MNFHPLWLSGRPEADSVWFTNSGCLALSERVNVLHDFFLKFCFTDPIPSSESESESCSFVSNSFQPHGLYSPWNSLGQNTGVGSRSLLQGIFPTQGSNPGLPHCRQILYQLCHKESPRILEWGAYCFSSVSSWPRNWTRVCCLQVDSLLTELTGKPLPSSEDF